MRRLQLSALSVLTAVPFANFAMHLPPPWHDIRVKHTWNAVPPNWEALGHPPAGTTIDLHLALKPHHENALVDALYNVSDPRSPKHVLSNIPPRMTYLHMPLLRYRYGAHLSKEQVAQLVAPHPDAPGLIKSWLGHHTVPSSSISTTHGGSWLKLTGIPVSQANELLGASYQVYRRIGTNDSSILRTVGYGLVMTAIVIRRSLAALVDFLFLGPGNPQFKEAKCSNHALGAASTSPRTGLYCHHHLWLASANSSLAMTTATRRRNATAATRYRNATAATWYCNATAATWYCNATAATWYCNATAATWYRNATAATRYRNATAATRYRNTTTATWHHNATTATWCRGATTATRRRGVTKTATRRVMLRQRQQHGAWRYDSNSDTARGATTATATRRCAWRRQRHGTAAWRVRLVICERLGVDQEAPQDALMRFTLLVAV
ncbi:Pro-kumamolisin, activation domain-containing protein [Lactarius pseudohatsudake]|nr:Pro-kumamolisin, activation domain-containing protein [Lactarius pseudohatsudake]